MRRDEDRGPTGSRVANQTVELLLVQRIESARGLVEDEQRRLRREREEEGELLLVPVRVLAVLATEIEIESFRDRLDVAVAHVAAKTRDVGHDLGASPTAELRQLAGDVSDLVLQCDRVAIGIEPEYGRRASCCVNGAYQELDRGGLPRPVRSEVTKDLAVLDGEVEVENAVTRAVVLCQTLCRDRICHEKLSVFSHFTRPPRCTLTVTKVPPPRTRSSKSFIRRVASR